MAVIGATVGKINLARKFKGGTFSNNTILLRTKNKEKHNPFFYERLFQSDLIQKYIWGVVSQKAQPNLQRYDLENIKIPVVLKDKQDRVATQTQPIENRIRTLRAQIIPPQEIINKILAREFKCNMQEVYIVEKVMCSLVSDTLTYRNPSIRNSVRWHKIAPIQDTLYKNNPHIKKLGKYIISTKNGWSPNCRESDSANYVFGVNSISADGVIKYDDLKTSDETRRDINDYYSKKGDLFVSRGNTVDLVALASIVKNMPDEKDIIFPDLFIKIDVNEKELNKTYLAYLFNSIVGRLYFKYAAKGKNQTMVKVSSDELNNFYLPIPPLKMQEEIVDEIKTDLDKQEEVKKKIESERNKIDEIIEKAIK